MTASVPLPEQRILRLARRLGLDAKRSEGFPDVVYRRLCIRYAGHSEELYQSNLAHEVAHFIVAPPSRKLLPNFGLGEDPDSMQYFALRTTVQASKKEEIRASLLGMSIEHWAGGKTSFTLEYHNWYEQAPTYAELPWEILLRAKLPVDDAGNFRAKECVERYAWCRQEA